MQQVLKEYVSIQYKHNVLDVFSKGQHIISQPFNSETGKSFEDQIDAEIWLLKYYPDLFTPR